MGTRLTNMLIDDGNADQTGSAVRGDGYYHLADGFHTVGYYLRGFSGRIRLEATLSDDPTEDDWFDIDLGDNEFSEATTGLRAFNVTGNYVYLRAIVERSHLEAPLGGLGHCERVVLSF